MAANSNILGSFIQQTYGSVENAHAQDKKADGKEDNETELDKEVQKFAIKQISKPISLIESMGLPTRLKAKELDQKTEVHPNLKNYDHSLDVNRSSGLGLISLSNEE